MTITASGNVNDQQLSGTAELEVTSAIALFLEVTPEAAYVLPNRDEQLTAIANFSDGTSSDVTNSVTWIAGDTNIATVTVGGLLDGVQPGATTVMATIDDIVSNTVNVTVCTDISGPCIDVLDTGNGKLFTSTPSQAYLQDNIGYSLVRLGGDYEYIAPEAEQGPGGWFALFRIDDGSQDWLPKTYTEALCNTYNEISLKGRTNWRLPTIDELEGELYEVYGDMSLKTPSWQVFREYASSSLVDGTSDTLVMSLGGWGGGSIFSFSFGREFFVSCVSEP